MNLLQGAILVREMIGFALLLHAIGVSAQGNRSAAPHPNIVYVIADQWRAQATGYAGDPNVRTPNLDRLAQRAVNFSNAISVLPVCTPHRAALLTGKYPQTTGMFMNDLYLPATELTMGEIFKSAGYNTAYIGKWHLDGHGRLSYIPEERRQGFDYWQVLECTHDYNNSKYFSGNDSAARYWDGYDVYGQTRNAQEYISDHATAGKPFILVLAYGAPHFPHKEAPEHLKATYDTSAIVLRKNVPDEMKAKAKKEAVGYYAHCTAIDSCVGALQQTIQSSGIGNNTIIVFTSDHGEMLGSHGVKPQAKQRPWDESIKVPFLIYAPRQQASRGKRVDVPLNTPDILPTLLGLSGIDKPSGIEGEDLSALITGKRSVADRAVLFMNIAPFAEDADGEEYRGIRTSRYTYVRNLNGPWMFFDNIADPYQQHNLVNKPDHRKAQAMLDKELKMQLKARGDEFKSKAYYIEKWGYTVSPENGEIPYGPGPYEAQSPAK